MTLPTLDRCILEFLRSLKHRLSKALYLVICSLENVINYIKSQAFLHGLIFVCLGYRGVLLFHVILKYRNGFSKNQSKYSYPHESIYSVPNTQLGKRDTSETEFTLLSFDITATIIMDCFLEEQFLFKKQQQLT